VKSDEVQMCFEQALEEAVSRAALKRGFDNQEREKLKILTDTLVQGLVTSVLINSKLNNLPNEVLLTCVIEMIARWNELLDQHIRETRAAVERN
jgi:hypothetical protein